MAIIITNKFYNDYGMEYAVNRLKKEFALRGVALSERKDIYVTYEKHNYSQISLNDFVIFWDKDISLAKSLESNGIKLFPSAYSLEICDDKEKTYAAVAGKGIELIDTMIYPLTYDVNDEVDERFLRLVESKFGYPIVIKHNVGSQGRQVYLAENYNELLHYAKQFNHIPHQYQRFTGEYGSDIRLYVVGDRVVAAVKRQNTTSFRSNIACGGKMELFEPRNEFIEAALKISSILKMDFGSVDFLCYDKPVFLEANSNAYFKGIEALGVGIADKIADYILEKAYV